jgi:hypothetical protein
MNAVQYARNAEKKVVTKEAALKAVDFEVVRQPMLVDMNGQQIKTEREAVIRIGEEPQILGYVSPDYNLITHKEALSVAFEAMENMGTEYVLQSLELDRNGAKMYAQFKFLKQFEITKGDVLNPVLTLVNGLDGYNALGFDLESIRLVCLNLARSAMKDVSQRFMHTRSADPNQLAAIAQKSLGQFETNIIPMYRNLASTPISRELAVKAVAVAVKEGAVPLNVANFAKHCVESDRALDIEKIDRTMWHLFNAFTWASTKRGAEVSATRDRDIRAGISKLFADGGHSLIKQAETIEMNKVNEIFKAA